MVGGKLVDELSSVEGTGGKPQVALQWEEAVYGLAASYGVQIFAAGKRDLAVGEEFQVSGELAPGFSDAPGKALDFAQVRRIEGEDAICLTEFSFFNNYGFSLVITRIGHFKIL